MVLIYTESVSMFTSVFLPSVLLKVDMNSVSAFAVSEP